MVEALTEGDGELFVVNVDHISQLKACVNLKKQFQPKSAHTKKITVFFSTFIGPSFGGRAILS